MILLQHLRITLGDQHLVDIALHIKTTLGLVGKSGSGKSLTLKALLGLLPGSMMVDMQIEAPFELARGHSMGFVPQNPFTALSPLSRVGDQFHTPEETAIRALVRVGLDEWALNRFPMELSGGQLQRVVIAMAIVHQPKVLLLDEPTTALDCKSKQEILDLLIALHQEEKTAMLFVGHDMAAVAQVCHHIAVIDEGRIVEQAPTAQLIKSPTTAQAQALIGASFAYRKWRT